MLVKHEGKVAFVGECKIWSGVSDFSKAIDQLLSYVTWRDTKTALIIFSRNKNLSKVLEQISPAVKEHKCFKRQLNLNEEYVLNNKDTTFKFKMCHPDDPQKKLYLTVLVFDVPIENDKQEDQGEVNNITQ